MPSAGRLLAALSLACALLAGGYVAWAAMRDDGSGTSARAVTPLLVPPSAGAAPTVVFQHVDRDTDYAHVAIASDGGAGSRHITPLICERVHMAAGRGLCLLSRQGPTGAEFTASVVDASFRVQHKVTIPGLISRARVSRDGRYGATTSFVTGHSYADAGEFSTHTSLIDMARGKVIADLEDFDVTKDSEAVQADDRNFWGVTFARDSDRFYATMRVGGHTWLIEGSVRGRDARVLHENVECPSLSPDGTRIAYKKRVDEDGVMWRLHVLDLRTMADIPLSEHRMVDDQAEWLDDDTVLYGLEASVWAIRADGKGTPRRLLTHALSPAAIQAPSA